MPATELVVADPVAKVLELVAGGVVDGVAKLCVKLCRLRSQLRRKTLPHPVHLYGLISV